MYTKIGTPHRSPTSVEINMPAKHARDWQGTLICTQRSTNEAGCLSLALVSRETRRADGQLRWRLSRVAAAPAQGQRRRPGREEAASRSPNYCTISKIILSHTSCAAAFRWPWVCSVVLTRDTRSVGRLCRDSTSTQQQSVPETQFELFTIKDTFSWAFILSRKCMFIIGAQET